MLSEKEDEADDNIGSYDGSHLVDDVTGSTIFTDDSVDHSVVCSENITYDHDEKEKTSSTNDDVEAKDTPQDVLIWMQCVHILIFASIFKYCIRE